MSSDDLTLRILTELRDEVRTTRDEVHQLEQRLGERIDRVEHRLDGRIDRLEARLVESEIRTSTAINGLAGTLHDVRDLLVDRLDLRDRVSRCERDIGEIKTRLG